MHHELLAKLKALGEPTRLRIVTLLSRGELTVSEIMHVLGQSQPRVSRHLKLLADAGLCERFPEGGWVFYRLARSRVGEKLAALIEEMSDSAEADIARDLARLEDIKRLRAETAEKYFEKAAGGWARIRSLQFPEAGVEEAMREMAGDRRFDLHLDVGTGTGRMLELFADRAGEGMGVDLSREMLSVARSKISEAGLSRHFVRQADASALPVETGAADLVTVHQVLHYLDEPARAIAECARVLAPGGLFLIVDFAEHEFEAFRVEHHHRHLGFGAETMSGWLAAAGLVETERREFPPEGVDSGLTVTIWSAEKSAGEAAA